MASLQPMTAPTGSEPERQDSASPILLYDGLCGFCNGAVQFALKRDRRGVLRFAPLQGDYARGLMARHPALANIDSLILVEPGTATGGERVYIRSAGALRTARYLDGAWPLTRALVVVPRPVRDWAYDLFARWRYRLFGRYDACPIPTPEQRARFID
jgi:predicted DCC family thiol-disulfide oxidoreductase YuxK